MSVNWPNCSLLYSNMFCFFFISSALVMSSSQFHALTIEQVLPHSRVLLLSITVYRGKISIAFNRSAVRRFSILSKNETCSSPNQTSFTSYKSGWLWSIKIRYCARPGNRPRSSGFVLEGHRGTQYLLERGPLYNYTTHTWTVACFQRFFWRRALEKRELSHRREANVGGTVNG